MLAAAVRRWTNVAARETVTAACPRLADRFGKERVEDHLVFSSRHAHNVTEPYLNGAPTENALADTLGLPAGAGHLPTVL